MNYFKVFDCVHLNEMCIGKLILISCYSNCERIKRSKSEDAGSTESLDMNVCFMRGRNKINDGLKLFFYQHQLTALNICNVYTYSFAYSSKSTIFSYSPPLEFEFILNKLAILFMRQHSEVTVN